MHDDRPDPADVGITHVALPVRDVRATAAFYGAHADLRIVHQRNDEGTDVVWLADGVRPFVLVCIAHADVSTRLDGPYAHLGVGCRDRDDLDARVRAARKAHVPVDGPHDSGPPIGYWAILTDPDGHQLELSVGQEISAAVGTVDHRNPRSNS